LREAKLAHEPSVGNRENARRKLGRNILFAANALTVDQRFKSISP
jgi:hypothetical protein